MKKLILVSCALIGAVFASQAYSADVAAGKAKSGLCMSCHGKEGKAMIPLYPHLAGQNEMYLAKQLKNFRSGARKDPAMAGFAKMLNDDDIANLAAYYASLK